MEDYECSANEFNFRYHKKYAEGLKASLEPFNIYFDKVYVSYIGTKRSFTVYTTGPIKWINRQSKSMSAHNFLYVNDDKIKLYEWLNYSVETRAKILNIIN